MSGLFDASRGGEPIAIPLEVEAEGAEAINAFVAAAVAARETKNQAAAALFPSAAVAAPVAPAQE